jgi:hypothetical protein
MVPKTRSVDDDICPVSDDLLGQLYRSSEHGLIELIATVSPDLRAALAAYCYRRSHLQAIGLAIASTCDEQELMTFAGKAGAVLFARSREAPAVPVTPYYAERRKISLASGPLRANVPIDDDEPALEGEVRPLPNSGDDAMTDGADGGAGGQVDTTGLTS